MKETNFSTLEPKKSTNNSLTWQWCSRNGWSVLTDGQMCPIFTIYTGTSQACRQKKDLTEEEEEEQRELGKWSAAKKYKMEEERKIRLGKHEKNMF